MIDKIKEYSKEINIDIIGFVSINEMDQNIYLDPNNIMDLSRYNSIISIALAYPHECDYLANIKDNEVYFGCSSWGCDYHVVLQKKMNLLGEYLKKLDDKVKYLSLVDNHPLNDKYIATKAGLGFIGRNNLLINKDFGSYIFIGNILTNLEFPPIKRETEINCLNCLKCVQACPTKALDKAYQKSTCLSYLTQKKELNMIEQQSLTNCIFGCDMCQKVCPYNQINYNHHPEFNPTGIEFINVDQYKHLSNKEFQIKYGHLAGAYRGRNVIERNIFKYQKRKEDNYEKEECH